MNNIYVIHAGEETLFERCDIRWHEIPPRTPYEIPAYDAQVIQERVPHAALVVVEAQREGYNTTLMVEDALRKAEEELYKQEEILIANYIEAQREDRLKRSAAPLPPQGLTAKAIVKHGINLSEYGINPVGYKSKEKRDADNERYAEVERQNKDLSSQVLALSQQVRELMEALTGANKAPTVADARKGR